MRLLSYLLVLRSTSMAKISLEMSSNVDLVCVSLNSPYFVITIFTFFNNLFGC